LSHQDGGCELRKIARKIFGSDHKADFDIAFRENYC